MKKTLVGPSGLRLVLDTDEVHPENPGEGTPAMLYLGKMSGTYWCALDTGEVDERELSSLQYAWLTAQEELVEEFLS